MERIVTIVLALGLTLSLVGIAVGAERSKEPLETGKQFERIEAAFASGQAGLAAPSAEDEIGDATIRLWGDDRFETAVAISEFWWAYENTFIVYLATGQNFPDALAAGPSTFFYGPLLLVQRDQLPEVTRQELDRLRPCFIIAVGGPGAIRDAVLEEADTYTEDC